nr:MAG TPA: hypothetical protein [Inoviridae sp.]DAX09269.1 MAG TPA: hypothetical protein [Inoviridae sp.]
MSIQAISIWYSSHSARSVLLPISFSFLSYADNPPVESPVFFDISTVESPFSFLQALSLSPTVSILSPKIHNIVRISVDILALWC